MGSTGGKMKQTSNKVYKYTIGSIGILLVVGLLAFVLPKLSNQSDDRQGGTSKIPFNVTDTVVPQPAYPPRQPKYTLEEPIIPIESGDPSTTKPSPTTPPPNNPSPPPTTPPPPPPPIIPPKQDLCILPQDTLPALSSLIDPVCKIKST